MFWRYFVKLSDTGPIIFLSLHCRAEIVGNVRHTLRGATQHLPLCATLGYCAMQSVVIWQLWAWENMIMFATSALFSLQEAVVKKVCRFPQVACTRVHDSSAEQHSWECFGGPQNNIASVAMASHIQGSDLPELCWKDLLLIAWWCQRTHWLCESHTKSRNPLNLT